MMQSSMLSDNFGRRRVNKGRGYFWLYLVIAIVFLVLEALGNSVPSKVRSYANDIAAPILTVLEQPIRATQDGLERLAGVSDIYLENQNLREENERLRQWRETALQLNRENEQLRSILKVPGREVPTAATGRVVGSSGGAFEQSVVINVGHNDGVRRNAPVIDDGGIVGRIIEVGYLSSRVLLLTDVNSHIPVKLERTGDLAIIEGTNELFLEVKYLPPTVRLEVGDRFLTSGHGGAFPPDLPMAEVLSVTLDKVTIRATSSISSLDYVRVMNYQPKVPEDELIDPEDQLEPVTQPSEIGAQTPNAETEGGANGT
ncbi:rod shape-determining protein MreC [Kordiimonas sp. SCSIO 12610]|uniref:rod shape-determining protein MreC n=1 Tax=Kordiimonas sp. SCSIO 12610 TaxID=2829597 RepID=UPI00210CC240|nr:rod shape-determining protein MreC [Kordiimonas sp. SCSIO 12610]UTW54418.1 rod shape-determining protein MreC [Kordiimonas sp. SCSIO 12610]